MRLVVGAPTLVSSGTVHSAGASQWQKGTTQSFAPSSPVIATKNRNLPLRLLPCPQKMLFTSFNVIELWFRWEVVFYRWSFGSSWRLRWSSEWHRWRWWGGLGRLWWTRWLLFHAGLDFAAPLSSERRHETRKAKTVVFKLVQVTKYLEFSVEPHALYKLL